MTTVGFLYPGHFAEDDYPRMEILLDSTIRLVVRHTESPDDAYREDALRELGAPGRLRRRCRGTPALGSPVRRLGVRRRKLPVRATGRP